ncbi:MAG: hypothetical protein Q9187_006738 [Circinaria calcarea]
MASPFGSIDNIRIRISTLESELRDLREQLALAEGFADKNVPSVPSPVLPCNGKENPAINDWRWPLAAEEYTRLNPNPRYVTHPEHLTSVTSVKLIENYDVVLDCTDHPTSRYLISDAAVLVGRPLVSASALRTDGQLMVLNNPPNNHGKADGGPCYRCVFPKPPPAESVVACGEGGILGPVVGVMGVLMALEAIKIIASTNKTVEGNIAGGLSGDTPSMLLFSAYNNPPFRSVRLRGKRARCIACSDAATITKEALASGSLDYAVFCGIKKQIAVLDESERVKVKDVLESKHNGKAPIILDVRDATQFDICHIDGSINVPYSLIESAFRARQNKDSEDQSLGALCNALSQPQTRPGDISIYCLCRFGNDSQLAVRRLKQLGFDSDGKRWIGDVKGGLSSWKRDVDPSWPEY